MNKQNINDSGQQKYNSMSKKFVEYKNNNFLIVFIFVLSSLLLSNCTNKQKMESIIYEGDNTYWDLIVDRNTKTENSGFCFTKKGAIIHYEIVQNTYRILDDDCKNSDLNGCYGWSLSQDSVLKTFIKGGIELSHMKIVKCNKDTILGYDLNGKGVVLFVRVKDLNSIVKQGDPRRKELLKGRLAPLDL
jgi:hypothetical protein